MPCMAKVKKNCFLGLDKFRDVYVYGALIRCMYDAVRSFQEWPHSNKDKKSRF